MSGLRRCDGAKIPWDDLDPGIVGVVRALVADGFEPTDSGDGKHKATLGWDPEEYGDMAHVVIATTFEAVGADLRRLAVWAERIGDGVEVQASVYRLPDADEPQVTIILGGDALFGWSP